MKGTLIGLLLLSVLTTATGMAKESRVVKATIDPDGVQRVEIVGGSYFFNPDHIVVRVNVPVELKVRKEPGMVPHDLVLKAPEAGIDVTAKLGEEPGLLTFTPTKTGSYRFYCDKKLLFMESHREKGMEGVLEVVE